MSWNPKQIQSNQPPKKKLSAFSLNQKTFHFFFEIHYPKDEILMIGHKIKNALQIYSKDASLCLDIQDKWFIHFS